MADGRESAQAGSKRVVVSQAEIPNENLQSALRIAQAIWESFAGKSAPPHSIAMALDFSPTSGRWRNLCGSSLAYGLTEGGYNAAQIALTDLGRRVVAPTEEGESERAVVEALMKPRVQREFFQKYNRAKFPKDEIGRNVLVTMGLPKDRSEQAFEILKENGVYAGIIQQTKTGLFVAVDTPAPRATTGTFEVPEEAEELPAEPHGRELVEPGLAPGEPPQDRLRVQRPKQLFVAHGKKHKALEDLKKILNEFKIPYKVAIDEPNKGRPISSKVAELMNECSAGIFIFTKDEKFMQHGPNGDLTEVWRPSENVVYELGAANILWEKKIIIVREEGVNFPSDFSDLGYITFKDGEIASKALEIFKELIALELVKVTAA